MIRGILFILILALSGILFLEWHHWPPDLPDGDGRHALDAPASLDPAPKPGDFLEGPLHKEAFLSIVERPLFLPDRRPPEEEPKENIQAAPQETVPVVPIDTLDLNAVLITPGEAIAWVRTKADPKPKRFRVGDHLEGWTIKAIHPDELELEQGGHTDRLILRDYSRASQKTPKKPAQPSSPAVRRPADRPSGAPSVPWRKRPRHSGPRPPIPAPAQAQKTPAK